MSFIGSYKNIGIIGGLGALKFLNLQNSSPILSLQFYGCLLLASSMCGSHLGFWANKAKFDLGLYLTVIKHYIKFGTDLKNY
jgi:hypothetical protein